MRFQEWYNRSKGWSHVFRAKDKEVAQKIAKAMTDAVNNQKIGYDQSQRTTLFDEAEKKKFVISKIKKACETDCSALVSVCVNAAGISVSKDMYTGNEAKVLKATKAFQDLTSATYTQDSQALEVGDILLGEGHTAVVVEVTEIVEQKPEKKAEKKTYFRVQVAACRNLTSANAYVKMCKERGVNTTITHQNDWFKVIVGDYETKEQANAMGRYLNTRSLPTYIYNVTY